MSRSDYFGKRIRVDSDLSPNVGREGKLVFVARDDRGNTVAGLVTLDGDDHATWFEPKHFIVLGEQETQ